MDDALISISDEKTDTVNPDKAKKSRRRSSKRKNAPTLEAQLEIFKEDTLEQIRIFREARSQWIEDKDSRKGGAEYDSELLFGEEQSRRKRQTWLKRTGLDKLGIFYSLCRRMCSKEPKPQKLTKASPPKEKVLEEGLQSQEVKPVKSIMKIVKQTNVEEIGKAGESGDVEDVTIVDEKEPIKRRRMESSDEFEKDAKKRKKDGGKKKPLRFERIPGPEEQCKCDHSGEYTVLVKGVCFCDRPKRPTCIPIIPPEYFKPHTTECLKPDVKIERKDSLLYHKSSLRKSRELLLAEKKGEEEKEQKQEVKDEIEEQRQVKDEIEEKQEDEEIKEKQDELIEIKPASPPPTSQEALFTKEELPEPEKSKDVDDDIQIEKLMSHHKTHFREDHHHPIHFQELPEDKSESTLKTVTNESLLPESPSETGKRHHFLLKRKGSRIPVTSSRRREFFENSSNETKTDKDKKNKLEHGHVHFDTDALSYQGSDHEDLDNNKYYTKYGRSGENFKRKQDKTTMTVLIDVLYDWWKRKPK